MKIVFNMRSKMFLITLSINLVITLIISVLFYQNSADFFTQQYAKSLYNRLYIGLKNVDEAFQNVYLNTTELAFDINVRFLIQQDNQNDFRHLSEIFRSYKEKNDLIDNIYCYIPSSQTLIRADEYNSVRKLNSTEAADWLYILQRQEGMQPLFTKDIFSSSTKSVYLYKTSIQNTNHQTLAYIVFTISERALYFTYLSDIVRNKDTIIYLFDNLGNTVSANRYIEQDNARFLFDISNQKDTGLTDITIDDKPYLTVYATAPFSHYLCCLSVNKQILLEQLFIIQFLTIICSLLIFFAGLIFIYFMAVKLNEPIEELAYAMQKASKGNLSIRAKVHSHDEIGKLANIFNHMLSRIDKLIDDLANEKALKKEAELNALQYQIRPHFIYNTLNAIRFAALMQGAKNISNLLGNFINLLQVSTNRKGSFATLQEEVTTLKNYISLQEFRMMDTFKANFDIDENTLHCCVPRLILQPLVENSIIHGPSETKSFCHIIIRSYIKDNSLYLEVEDDGKGMSEQQMQSFTNMAKKTSGGYSSVGVYNIKERLRLYYADKGELNYFSDNKTYTIAQIKLPVSYNIDEYKL